MFSFDSGEERDIELFASAAYSLWDAARGGDDSDDDEPRRYRHRHVETEAEREARLAEAKKEEERRAAAEAKAQEDLRILRIQKIMDLKTHQDIIVSNSMPANELIQRVNALPKVEFFELPKTSGFSLFHRVLFHNGLTLEQKRDLILHMVNECGYDTFSYLLTSASLVKDFSKLSFDCVYEIYTSSILAHPDFREDEVMLWEHLVNTQNSEAVFDFIFKESNSQRKLNLTHFLLNKANTVDAVLATYNSIKEKGVNNVRNLFEVRLLELSIPTADESKEESKALIHQPKIIENSKVKKFLKSSSSFFCCCNQQEPYGIYKMALKGKPGVQQALLDKKEEVEKKLHRRTFI